ncbi:MAG TPA: sigma-70 family RNA polymerase sigma factor [Methylomirabilota bacterium]|nr:sigma-70 family RNA polymerase sigma factor [Methylomirabilota bacterium]
MNHRDNLSGSDEPPGEAKVPGGGFNTTHWSVVMLAGQETSPESASALERLCRAYWYPLYAYARRQGHSPPDGQDLTQQFFAGFIEKKYFGLANPDRGRFRCFLLASFKHFLANEYNRSQTAKRGGEYAFVSWDETEAEMYYGNEPAHESSPDRLFERAWVLTLLEKVMKDLQQEYVRVGKGKVFDALHVFLSGEKSESTYAEIGERIEMSESAIKMAVSRLRQRYGEKLRSEIANTLTGPTSVEDELRHLLGALSH